MSPNTHRIPGERERGLCPNGNDNVNSPCFSPPITQSPLLCPTSPSMPPVIHLPPSPPSRRAPLHSIGGRGWWLWSIALLKGAPPGAGVTDWFFFFSKTTDWFWPRTPPPRRRAGGGVHQTWGSVTGCEGAGIFTSFCVIL